MKAISSSGSAGLPNSVDPTDSLKRSPLKRERLEDGTVVSDEIASKKTKLDLPDSGCDCSADKMETDDVSSTSATMHTADQASSEHSSDVFSDGSETCKNKPAKNCGRSESCDSPSQEEAGSASEVAVS